MSGRVSNGLASDLGASVSRSRTAIKEGGRTDLAPNTNAFIECEKEILI